MSQENANYDTVVLHENLLQTQIPLEHYIRGDFAAWRERLRRKLYTMLGLHRMPAERSALHLRRYWRRETEHGTIERLSFTSEAGYDVPAFFCLPHNLRAPYPVFICLQGHSTGMHNSIAVSLKDYSKSITVEGDRDFGLICMRNGIAALCIEQRAFGECMDQRREQMPWCHNPAMQALMLGRTLLGERVYDVDRAIDLLYAEFPDIDRTRIGVMGNSGGGTTSLFAGALLDRLTHVMPSCYFCSFRDSLMSINHCLCNYVPDLLAYAEMAEIAGLCAPKPLVIVSGDADDIFPITAAQHEFARLQEIYHDVGEPDNCRHVIGKGGHRFYAADAWPVMKEYLSFHP